MEHPQTGFQDSPQSYQSLVAQNGQFSPAMEGSHSPFLPVKGAGTLQSRKPHICFAVRRQSRGVWCVTFAPVPGETEQSYYDSDAQRQSSSFWPQYSSPGFSAPQPHPPLASCPSETPEQYCPRVVKRKNTHPQRPDREGHVTAMSAYPGPSLISILITALCLHMIKQ